MEEVRRRGELSDVRCFRDRGMSYESGRVGKVKNCRSGMDPSNGEEDRKGELS